HFARGAQKVVFMGSDVLGHPHIDRLLEDLVSFGIPFSLPSTRLDKLTDDFLALLGRGGVRTLTIAPEAAHWKRKLFIAKPIRNEDIVDVARRARAFGIRKLKLYFIIGYPDTFPEEVQAIVDLYREVRRYIPVTGTVSVFVPKPYTPFQYLPMERIDVTAKYLKFIKKETSFDVGNPKRAALQALLSIGDEKISELLLRAYKNFNYHYWLRVGREIGIDVESYLYGRRNTPWMEKIRTYVPPRGIKEGFERAMEVMT
ncbi:MAG: radical SAM protein, partial [Candidatus Diapherotrites archaeon]|nr:radical SAM protein [Candidatus Diapherotrites archaeon]